MNGRWGLLCFLVLFVLSPAWAAEKVEDLDFGLLAQLAQQKSGANVVISSNNLEKAFQVLQLGATGAAQDELTAYHQKHPPYPLTQPLKTVQTALCLWVRPDWTFQPVFVGKARALHGGMNLMRGGDAAEKINDCVSDATNGQIKKVLNEDGVYNAVIATALHFKGKWFKPFDKAETKPGPFVTDAQETLSKPMMRQQGGFSYHQTEAGQMIQLPYAEDGLTLTVFLPAAPGVGAWLAQEDLGAWRHAVALMRTAHGTLVLPKVDLRFSKDIKKDLQGFGLAAAFGDNLTDYAHILVGRNFWIDAVYHQTVVTWDEETTEASAATVAAMGGASPSPAKPFEMIVDHPFFFTIGNRDNSLILFSGIVNNP